MTPDDFGHLVIILRACHFQLAQGYCWLTKLVLVDPSLNMRNHFLWHWTDEDTTAAVPGMALTLWTGYIAFAL
jgi:hypothetical protein